MADSELSIEVTAQAGKAVTQLDKIVESLGRIEKVLDGLMTPLKSIENLMEKVSGTTINLNVNTKQVDNATKKLKKMKELNGATNESGGSGAHQRGFISDVEDNNTKGFTDSTGKVIDNLGKNLPAVTQEFAQLGETVEAAGKAVEDFGTETNNSKNAINGLSGIFDSEFSNITSLIQAAIVTEQKYKAVLADLKKNAKNTFDVKAWNEAIVLTEAAREYQKNYNNELVVAEKAKKAIASISTENPEQIAVVQQLAAEYQALTIRRKELSEASKLQKENGKLFYPEDIAATDIELAKVNERIREIYNEFIQAGKAADSMADQSGLKALPDKLAEAASAAKNAAEGTNELGDSTKIVGSYIQTLYSELSKYEEYMKQIKNLEISVDEGTYQDTLRKINEIKKQISDYNKISLGTPKPATPKVPAPEKKHIEAWRALATAVNTATRSLGQISDAGIKAAKNIATAFQGIGARIKAQLDKAAKAFSKFKSNVGKAIKNLTGLWRKFLNTFTYSMIFKAIMAITSGFYEATKSLAQFSNVAGTQFNDSISNIIADFNQVSRAILAMIEPIINKVIPIFDALAEKLSKVSNTVAQFFAAISGQGYAMKAKKRVDNYAESLDKTKDKAKKLKSFLLGIDELNVFDNKSSEEEKETPYMDEWEVTPIDPKVMEFADNIKDKFKDLKDWLKDNFGELWDDLFGDFDLKQTAKDLWKPIGEAWEENKKKIGDSFAHLINSMGKLLKDIGRDFMEVWKQDKTKQIFSNLMSAAADVAEGVARLVDNFRDAWNENETGKKILEDIRDIILIITEWVAKAAAYFKEWAKDVNFKPLLTSFEQLLQSLKKIVDFVGGVLFDIFTMLILSWVKFLIEEGIPLLNKQFAKIADGFPADKVRQNLQKIWKAIEKLGEEIFKGVAIAIGDIGTMFNQFLDSKRFEDFVDTIVTIMSKLDASDVRKIIDGIAIAIGDVATALIDFVNSEQFMAFIDKLDKWLANASAQDIANILKGIAAAILLFKFAQFVGPGVTAFLTFMGALQRIDFKLPSLGIGELATKIPLLGDGLTKLSGLMSSMGVWGTVLTTFASIIGVVFVGAIVAAVAALILSGGDVEKATDMINGALAKIGEIDFIGIATTLAANLGEMVNKVFEVLAGIDWKEVWDIITELFIALVEGVATLIDTIDWSTVISALVQCVIGLVLALVTHLPEIIAAGMDLVFSLAGALVEALAGAFKGLGDALIEIGGDIIGGVFKGIGDAIANIWNWIKTNIVDPFIQAFKDLFGIHSPSTVMAEIGGFLIEGLLQGISDMIETVGTVIQGIVDTIVGLFQAGVEAIKQIWNGIVGFFSGLWATVTQIFSSAWTNIQKFFSDAWNAISKIWNGAKDFFGKIIDNIKKAFDAGVKGIAKFFEDAWNTVKKVWSGAKDWFDKTVQGIKDAFDKGIKGIGKFFEDVWNAIVKVWSGAKAWFEKIVQGIKDAFDKGIKGVGKFFEDVWKGIVKVWEKAGEWFKGLVEKISKGFESGVKGIKKFWDDLWGGIKKVWEKAGEWFSGILKSIKSAFSNSMKAIQEFWDGLWDAITSVWNSAGEWFGEKVKDIIKAIGDAFAAAWDKLKSIGKNVLEGIFKGLQAGVAGAAGFLKSKVVDPIVRKIKSMFGIHSPSTVMEEEVGQYLTLGMYSGMEEEVTDVSWIKERVTDPFINEMKTLFGIDNGPSTVMAEIGMYLCQGLHQGFESAQEAFFETVTIFAETVTTMLQEFWAGLQEMWIIVPEWFQTTIFEPLLTSFTEMMLNITEQINVFFEETTIKVTDFFTLIQEMWITLPEWFNENVIIPLTTLVDETCTFIMERINELYAELIETATQTYESIQEIWENAVEWFTELLEEIRDTFEEILTEILELWQENWEAIAEIWEEASEWLKEKLEEIRGHFEEALEAILELWQENWEGIAEIWEEAPSWFQEILGEIYDSFAEMLEAMQELWEDNWAAIEDIWGNAPSWFESILEEIRDIFEEKLNEILELWEQLWEDIKEIWSEALEFFAEILNQLVAMFYEAADMIKNAFVEMFNLIREKADETFDMILQHAQEVAEAIRSLMAEINEGLNQVIEKANNAKALAGSVGGAPSFASGGFPKGENGLFYANSSEMVGKFTNGQTAVANNDQIVTGIMKGVTNAITDTLGGLLSNIASNQREQMNQKTSITLDGRELVGALDKRKARNGFSFKT